MRKRNWTHAQRKRLNTDYHMLHLFFACYIILTWTDMTCTTPWKINTKTWPVTHFALFFFCNVRQIIPFEKRPKFHRYDTVVGFKMLFVKFSAEFFFLFTELLLPTIYVFWKHSDKLIDCKAALLTEVRFISGRLQLVMAAFEFNIPFLSGIF